MSEEIEIKLNKIPVVKQLVTFTKAIKLKSLEGMSLYDILEMYNKRYELRNKKKNYN